MKKIGVVDYGIGNVKSIENAILKAGGISVLSGGSPMGGTDRQSVCY